MGTFTEALNEHFGISGSGRRLRNPNTVAQTNNPPRNSAEGKKKARRGYKANMAAKRAAAAAEE